MDRKLCERGHATYGETCERCERIKQYEDIAAREERRVACDEQNTSLSKANHEIYKLNAERNSLIFDEQTVQLKRIADALSKFAEKFAP